MHKNDCNFINSLILMCVFKATEMITILWSFFKRSFHPCSFHVGVKHGENLLKSSFKKTSEQSSEHMSEFVT